MQALNVLATAWQWNASGLICCGALLLLYLALGVWKQPRSLIYFLIAEALIVTVVCSPLDALAQQYLLTAEAIERILIALAAPYLLVVAIPRKSGSARFNLDFRLAWALGMIAIAAWFMPRLLDWGLASGTGRLVEFATLLLGGMAFWWPIHSPFPKQRIRLMPTSLFYLAAGTVWVSLTGLLLAFSPPWSYLHYAVPADTLHIADSIVNAWSLTREYDQQTAGLLFWVFSGFFLLSEVMAIYVRWYNSPEVRREGQPVKRENSPR